MLGGDGEIVETQKDVKEFLFGSLDVPLSNLETSLKNYVSVCWWLSSSANGIVIIVWLICSSCRSHQKNHLTSTLYPRRSSLSLLLKRKHQTRSQLGWVLLQLNLRLALMLMRNCFPLSQNFLPLASFSRFFERVSLFISTISCIVRFRCSILIMQSFSLAVFSSCWTYWSWDRVCSQCCQAHIWWTCRVPVQLH